MVSSCKQTPNMDPPKKLSIAHWKALGESTSPQLGIMRFIFEGSMGQLLPSSTLCWHTCGFLVGMLIQIWEKSIFKYAYPMTGMHDSKLEIV